MRTFSLIVLVLLGHPIIAQENYELLDDGARIYVENSGKGQPLIFVPGWTMTSRFFEHQKEYFSNEYNFITYDPRGQGISDKTETKNNYGAHADDLRQIIMNRNLEDVVLIGWSSGCLTVYEYIRNFGMDKIQKLVFIDEPPKWIGDTSSEWVYGDFDDYRSSLKGMVSKPSDPNGIIDWMLQNPVNSSARKWMNEEMKLTPSHVALSLYVDGVASDYTDDLDKIEVPSLFMVRSSWVDKAESWLKKKNPDFEVTAISSHAMFWEKPDQFNTLLSNFLNSK